jgi:catecholate siderophore receptor
LLPLGALMLAVSVSGWASNHHASADRQQDTHQSKPSPENVTATPRPTSGVTTVGKCRWRPRIVPQSLTVVNDKLIHDQGKDSFKSALENVIGITFEAGEGGRVGDNIRLRGFSKAGDIYPDGVRDTFSTT